MRGRGAYWKVSTRLTIATTLTFCCCAEQEQEQRLQSTAGTLGSLQLTRVEHSRKKFWATLNATSRDVYRLEDTEMTLAKTMADLMAEDSGKADHKLQMQRISARLRHVHTELEQTKHIREYLHQKYLRERKARDGNPLPVWLRQKGDAHAVRNDVLFFVIGVLLAAGTILFKLGE